MIYTSQQFRNSKTKDNAYSPSTVMAMMCICCCCCS